MLTAFKAGEWYLTVFCSGCHHRIPVFYDMTKGRSFIAGGYNGLTCPKCLHTANYRQDQVQHYHHPQELAFNHKPYNDSSIKQC